MIISVTERGTFKRCETQWGLTSKNGRHLAPIMSKGYLNIGTLMHKGLELWILQPDVPLVEHVIGAASEMGDKIRERYKRIVKASISEVELGPFYESVEMARSMAQNYQVRWQSPIPIGYDCIQPEQKLELPIPGSQHPCDSCDGGGIQVGPEDAFGATEALGPCTVCGGDGIEFHYLQMRLDGLLRRKHDGALVVLEHKTYGQRPSDEALKYHDQAIAYLWGCTQIGLGNVAGVAYDGLWTRAAPPKGKTLEDLFLRKFLDFKPPVLVNFERSLLIEVTRMYDAWKTGQHTFNRQWQGCWDCQMERACSKMLNGEDYESYILSNYAERDDDVEEVIEID